MKHTFALVLLLIHILSSTAQQPVSDRKFRKIQSYLDDATRESLIGVVVSVHTGPTTSWTGQSGYSQMTTKELMTTDRIFSMGSVGKMYNAVTVWQLVEQGRLKLDDPISAYLPEEIVNNMRNASSVTIRHLLGHTSGWDDYDRDTALNRLYLSGRLRLDTLSRMNTLRRYAYRRPALAEPGRAYHYSSTNYLLLAMIVDKVVPEGHSSNLRNLFTKEGFVSTYYRETPPERNVHYYGDLNQDGLAEDLTAETFETTNWFTGDDGVYASAEEAARFIQRLMKGGFLNEESLQMMKMGNTGIKTDTGLGLMADKSFPYGQLYGHSGRGIGTTADVYYFPKRDMTVVILCNTGLRSSSPKFKKAYLKMRTRIVMKLFLF